MARSRKRSKPVPTGKVNKSTDDIFCGNRRFVEAAAIGPTFYGYAQSAVWENRVQKYVPNEWEAIGNVQRCYHGTSQNSIAWIAIQSLKPGGRGWSLGLFGRGIYTAPNPIKAWGHARTIYRDGAHYKYLLEGRIALGKPYYPEKSGSQEDYLKIHGFDSLVAKGGTEIKGLYRGHLAYAEYVVYNPVQVVIDFVYEYKEVKNTMKYVAQTKISWSICPCKVDGHRCKNSYGESGCIVHKKKYGISKNDFEYCQFFEK